MFTASASEFRSVAARLPAAYETAPRGIFMVEPAAFRLEPECARDNRYMELGLTPDPDRALRQFRDLARSIAACELPAVCFPGNPDTPDAVFPNNVFGTAPGRALVGSMYHPSRRLEAARPDIRAFFTRLLGYELIDLSERACVAELTGALVIDRARRIGFCGMTERVDEAGARAMHAGFGLAATYCFELRPGEYHTNVVMSVLAGRAVVLDPTACVDPRAAEAILGCFEHRLELSTEEVRTFAGNCLAVTDRDVFMSARALDGLRESSRAHIERWGFTLHAVDVDELEKAGGSVRCMLGEVF